MLLGANGFGKTTLCAILRSLQTGDADHVIGRKTTRRVLADAAMAGS
jgi:ABC-type cobalamin/Fe3+-siderophores transport system ATPase subunit